MASVPSNEVRVNEPIIPIDQSIFEPDADQNAPLGTRLRLGDRTFYYAQASASVAGGTVLCANPVVASAQSGIFAVAAASAGVNVVTGTSSAAVTANLYAEGYFGEALGAGAGELYRIKSNAAGSTGFNITLYDRLNTAITSGTNYFLMPNLFKNVFVGSQVLHAPIGVAPTAVSSGYYFWLQTWGPAAPSHVAATPAAAGIMLGTTGGVIAAFTGGTTGPAASTFVIGKNSHLAATAGESNPVLLSILP